MTRPLDLRFALSLSLVWASCLAACGGPETPPAETRAPLGATAPAAGEAEAPASVTPEGPGAAEPADEAGSTRASREAALAAAPTGADVAREAASPTVRLAWVAAQSAEDGRGHEVATARALAFDVSGPGTSGRAQDPVLLVGALELSRYRHPEPGVLRFLLAEEVPVGAGTRVSLRYGDGAAVVLTQELALP